jgi:hypothetical protein
MVFFLILALSMFPARSALYRRKLTIITSFFREIQLLAVPGNLQFARPTL